MSINHLFENKIVFSIERRNIDPTNLLNFNISTVSDNSYYNLFDSYLVLDIKGKIDNGSSVVTEDNNTFAVEVNFQPAGLVTNSKANYTYINTNGDLVTQELNGSNEYIGASRTVINQLFSPKRIHDQDAGFLELPYNSSGSSIFKNRIEFKCASKNAGEQEIFGKLRIPYRDVIEGANAQSFINIKSLEVSLKLQDYKNFLYFNSNNKNVVYKDNGNASSEAVIKSLYIEKCELRNSVWVGAGDDAIQPSLRELTNVTISTKNITLKTGDKNYDDNIIVQFAPKYLIVYFTDKHHNHSKLVNIQPSFFRIAVSGGSQSTKNNFDNSQEIDSSYWDLVNYCCNTLREESLITYESWKNRMHYFVYPLSEMFSFKSSNIIELNLQFPSLTEETIMNVIFIKDNTV